MRRREDEVLQAIRAAHQFIGRHASLVTVSQAGAYQKLGEVLQRVRENAVEQVSESIAGQSATQAARAARRTLVEQHMTPIARIAEMLVEQKTEATGLRMPKSYLSAELLIAHARGMAVAAGRFRNDFVEAGLPTDFLEQMDAAILQFGEASVQRRQHHVARGGATQSVRAELSQARKLLKVMDAFVTRELHNDKALLAEWRLVKRLPRPVKARVALAAPDAPLALPSPPPPLQAIARVSSEELPVESRWSLRRLLPRLR